MWRAALLCLTIFLVACAPSHSYAGMAVIGHEAIKALDKTVVGRIFTGRTIEVEGVAVRPVNLKAGDAKRAAFLTAVLQQSDDDYVAYWIVRRAIGKGTPPPEVDGSQMMINFVQRTEGAIGYVDESDLVPGMNVLLLLP
jgi:hypothetical protein